MTSINHKEWFEKWGQTGHAKGSEYYRIEEMYQAFKARMIEEIFPNFSIGDPNKFSYWVGKKND